MDLIADISARS